MKCTVFRALGWVKMMEGQYDPWNPFEPSANSAYLNAENARLEKENALLRTRLDDLEKANSQLKREKDELIAGTGGSEYLESIERINTRLKEKVLELTVELNSLRTRLDNMQEAPGKEKRTTRRGALSGATVYARRDVPLVFLQFPMNETAGLRDFNVNGMGLYLKRQLKPGTKLSIQIYDQRLRSRVEVNGVLKWCAKTQEGKNLGGIRFTGLDGQTTLRLNYLAGNLA